MASDIKVKIVALPAKAGGNKWDKYIKQVLELKDGQALRITGIDAKEVNALRQRAYRAGKVRSKTIEENGKSVLYLYIKRQSEG